MRAFQSSINIGRFAGDRQFIRKTPCRPPRLRRREQRTIHSHFLFAKLANRCARKHAFDKGVILENEFLTLSGVRNLRKISRSALSRKNSSQVATGRVNSIKAKPRTKSEATRCKMERQCCPPILGDEVGRANLRFRNEGVEVTHVILETIRNVRFA